MSKLGLFPKLAILYTTLYCAIFYTVYYTVHYNVYYTEYYTVYYTVWYALSLAWLASELLACPDSVAYLLAQLANRTLHSLCAVLITQFSSEFVLENYRKYTPNCSVTNETR
uniref:Uncharacterized protein n=1 Tax=Glossina brevipalpis TaxID=37001 RepID=A0A1A9WUX2_9MUSC